MIQRPIYNTLVHRNRKHEEINRNLGVETICIEVLKGVEELVVLWYSVYMPVVCRQRSISAKGTLSIASIC